jgi:FeS assembly protein IscX
MELCWSNQTGIAEALMTAYPETDRLSLSLDRLREMVTALPQFKDAPYPPRETFLENVLWTWMRLAGEAAGG